VAMILPSVCVTFLVFGININVILVSASVESAWRNYCLELDGGTPSRVVAKFQTTAFRNVVYCLGRMPFGSLESQAFAELGKVHAAKLCCYFDLEGLVNFVINLVNVS
jgi:hypothetical protein